MTVAPGEAEVAAGGIAATVRAVPVAGSGAAAEESREAALRAPGETALTLPAGVGWRLSALASGYWAPEVFLPPGSRSPVTLALRRTASLGGQVSAPAGEKAPGALSPSLEIRFETSPGSHGPPVPRSVASCPVRDGGWRCELPAARLDLRVQATGFVPSYFWDVDLRPGKVADLGRVELLRGASLIGRVEVDGAVRGPAPRIEARPSVMSPPWSRASAERQGQQSFATRADPRGFFQLTGLPAGEYELVAELAGFSLARAPRIGVVAGAETELDEALVLRRPVTLEVHLAPPVDPYGEPWQLQLLVPDSPHTFSEVAKGQAGREGSWSRPGLSYGSYGLRVSDLAGSQWFYEPVELAPGETSVELALDLVAVDGRVRQGKEPVEATLWFARPKENRKIRFDADAKGEFSGALPAEGEWEVEIELPEEGVQALPSVEVRRLPGAAAARVEVRVPNTRLEVQVVDEKGAPVPAAEVVALGEPGKMERRAQGLTDEEGSLALRGLPAGPARVSAHKGDAASDWAAATVAEDTPGPRLTLVLREKVRLSGRVVAPERPVPGALVVFYPDLAPGGNAWVRRAVSGPDGRFELALDRSSIAGSLAVFAPGFAVRLLRAPLGWQPGQEHVFPVGQEGGDLRADLGGLPADGRRMTLLAHHGALVPLWIFLGEERATIEEDQLLVPRIEPGDYALCPWGGGAERCAGGSLPAGGDLRLDLSSRAAGTGASTPGRPEERR